jgi:hypothetical protein
MTNSAKEIVSPITNKILPPKTSEADARRQGLVPYDKPTPENIIMLFIDHQIGLMTGIRDFSSLAEYPACCA